VTDRAKLICAKDGSVSLYIRETPPAAGWSWQTNLLKLTAVQFFQLSDWQRKRALTHLGKRIVGFAENQGRRSACVYCRNHKLANGDHVFLGSALLLSALVEKPWGDYADVIEKIHGPMQFSMIRSKLKREFCHGFYNGMARAKMIHESEPDRPIDFTCFE